MEVYHLANGRAIPALGYGTWRNKVPEECVQGVREAIHTGFRHIDCAAAYQNEELVGQGIRESGVAREELFLTSKLKNTAHGYDNVRREVEASLERLGTDYLDLYLIHWSVVAGHGEDWREDNRNTWRAFEELYRQGILRSIGVSNFSVEHLENLLASCTVKPMVNQLLVHPGVLQEETRDFCRRQDILVEAYSPLRTLSFMSGDAQMQTMAKKHGRTIAQILLRFGLELGVLPLTKTVHPERMKENLAVFDFVLDDGDLHYLFEWSNPDYTEPDNTHERPPQIS